LYPKKLYSYIQGSHWMIPHDIAQNHPDLSLLLSKVTIPFMEQTDKLAWKHNSTGLLSLKEAYDFKKHHFPKVSWAKVIWSKDIPPSKSLLVWRLMLNKISTDDNLALRGCCRPSMCSLCCKFHESSFHQFFECYYAARIWNWFACIINMRLVFETVEEIWSLCNRPWNP